MSWLMIIHDLFVMDFRFHQQYAIREVGYNSSNDQIKPFTAHYCYI